MRSRWVMMGLALSACDPVEPIPDGPTVRIESPDQGGFVGTSESECFEVGVSGRLYNVERLADFELYVQGKLVPSYEIRATGVPGVWTFSTVVDLYPTNELGMSAPDATFAVRYPRYPWLSSRSVGWENRVRPFLAELVRPATRADMSAFVSRDVHTAIDARRSNCQSWGVRWMQSTADDVLSTTLTPDGLVALSPVVQGGFPHPALPGPQSVIDGRIATGVPGPNAAESCATYESFGVVDPRWETVHTVLVNAARAANAAALAAGLPEPYPSPSSEGNWLVCATWSSTVDYLGWRDPTDLALDPRPDATTGSPELSASWLHEGAPFQLMIQGEDVRIAWDRFGLPDPAMQGVTAVDACAVAGEVDLLGSTEFTVSSSTAPEALDVVTADIDMTGTSAADAIAEPCRTGAWRSTAEAIMSDAAPVLAGLYVDGVGVGAPETHPALALRDALHGAVPGRLTAEAHGAVTTQPDPLYEGGEPGVCSEDATGLTLVHDLRASPGASGWERGFVWWGDELVDERDPLSGVGSLGDPTTCHERDFADGHWVMTGAPSTATLLMTTAYPNAVMALASNAELDASWTVTSHASEVGAAASALGIPRSDWPDLVIELDAQQPSFVSPEWHPQVGHWVVTVTRSSTGEVLTRAVFNLWASSAWSDALTLGGMDDHADVAFSGFALEAVAEEGALRPAATALLAGFGAPLRALFAAHAGRAALEVGWPEWALTDGGPWFSSGLDATQRWQDNRALLPYVLTP